MFPPVRRPRSSQVHRLMFVIEFRSVFPKYFCLTGPIPASSHADYPFHTPGGRDKRWIGSGDLEEDGLQWVGGLM